MSKGTPHPLLAASPLTYARLLTRYGFEAWALPKVLGIGAGILLRQPLVAYTRLRTHRKVKAQEIRPDPLFLVGHWRSGTTHLQNLMNQDPQFGRVTLLQAALPNEYLGLPNLFKTWLGKGLPATRLMDNLPVSAEAPWEEELALTASTRFSFYHVSSFPGHMGAIFDDAVLFGGGRPEWIAEWWHHYHRFVQQVQFVQPGKRLLLKNPANTARIRILREHFPDARFLHLHRNPYQVYSSTVHLYLRAQEAWGLHPVSRERIVEQILDTYPKLMRAWMDQKGDIPPHRLAEIKFDDLETRPLEALREAYAKLELEGFEEALPYLQAYLESQGSYRKNKLTLEPQERDAIAERWGDFFSEWGYET